MIKGGSLMSENENVPKEQYDSWVLRIAKKLPESMILFIYFIILTIIASFIFQGEYEAISGGYYTVNNMLSVDGLIWYFYNFIPNFLNLGALGIIIVGAIGFVFAEKVGMLGSLIKLVSIKAPEKAILPIVVFLGIASSVASDAGYIVLIPIGGALYAGIGKHPLLGIMAAFAGVSAGFGASILPTPGDGLLGSVTAQIAYDTGFPIEMNYITMNYYFMLASTIMLTFLISWTVSKYGDKRVAPYEFIIPEDMRDNDMTKMTPEETKALKKAGVTLLILSGILAVLVYTGVLGAQQIYFNPVTLQPLETARNVNPLVDNIIVTMIMLFLFPSISYGRSIGKIKNTRDYINLTVDSMTNMAYTVAFFIIVGNFLATFQASGLSNHIGNQGANFLIRMNIANPVVLMLVFMMMSAFINLFMGGATTKWLILAPAFLPMLLLATDGALTPQAIQAGYRVADSATNVISPLMSFMGVIVVFCKSFVPDFEFGDLIIMMVPLAVSVLIGWTTFYLIWLGLGIPFGF
jgi:aminobenzoyl-glutamate transport protein